MTLDAQGDIIVVGSYIFYNVTRSNASMNITTSHQTFIVEIDNASTLPILNIDVNSANKEPSQFGNVIVLPNSDILTTGYVDNYNIGCCSNYRLSPMVTITDNTFSSRVCTSFPLVDAATGTNIYANSNFYQSAFWNNQLIMVGDYKPINGPSSVHDLCISKASILPDRTVNINVIKGYSDPNSSISYSGDGNIYNDFCDFRVTNILIKGDELIVLGIVRDLNELYSPNFEEIFVTSINLFNLEVNYTYVFSDLSAFGINLSRRVLLDNNGYFTFCGSKDVSSGSDKQLLLGRFSQDSKMQCLTEIELKDYPIGWVIFDRPFNSGTTLLDDNPSLSSTTPTVNNETNCSEAQPSCTFAKNFKFYHDGSTIFKNTVWGTQGSGIKYYIDGTLTIKNVTLDITNCDVVFGECAKIVFEGANAQLRANNSVFRPCDDNIKWKGLIFEGGTKHRIIGCEFKNSMTAIEVLNDNVNIEAVLNNTFYNCYIGLNLVDADFSGSIAGNHFEINLPENSYLDYNCKPIEGASIVQFQGIRAINSIIWSPIVNNEFISDDNLNSQIAKTWEFYGIYFNESVGVIQKNEFTNNTCAIFQSGNNSDQTNFLNKIDNNEITLARSINNALSQIVIIGNESQSINSLVTNNILVNNQRLDMNNYSGIYIETNNNTIIEQNEIRGFDIAINIHQCENPEISLNTVKGAYKYGIYVSLTEGELINCNTIDLQFSNSSTNSIGIYLSECDQDGGTISTINSNCIFNTEAAIKIEGPVSLPNTSNLPSIRNNFLYNYLNYGIYAGPTVIGDIGTPTVSGMNTFSSNNSSAINIEYLYVGSPCTAFGNFFELTPILLGTNVTISGAIGTTHSVASCSHQISGPASTISGKIDEELKCNVNGANIMNPNDGQGGQGEFVILSGSNGKEFLNSHFNGYVGSNVYGYYKNENYLFTLNELLQNQTISKNKYYLCMSQYYQAGKEIDSAIKYLKLIETDNELFKQRIDLEILRVKIISGTINKSQYLDIILTLTDIINAYNENYNQAYYLYSILTGNIGFRFSGMPNDIVWNGNSNYLSIEENVQLNIYPNPAKYDLEVEIISSSKSTQTSGATIIIFDITGKKLITTDFDIVAGKISINVSQLESGIYLINVIFADGQVRTCKFIKE